MPSDTLGNAALDPGFFDHRLLVEIESWEPGLHLGVSAERTPAEFRFQGGLDYHRNFDISGRVLAPKEHRGKSIRVWISPFGPEMRFGADEDTEIDEVGRLEFQPEFKRSDLRASLWLPESSLPYAATCLASCWKFIHLWTFDERDEEAGVRSFSFSAKIHKNLEPWAFEG